MVLTQREIVERLGISRGTLHRVLTGSPLVKASTRERVLRELEEVNYVPNIIAQGLKKRCTRTIGLIGPASLRMSNMDKVNAIYHAARDRGYSIALGYSDGKAASDAQCIRELRARMVDGFIAFGSGRSETRPVYQDLVRDGIPLVTLYPLPGLDVDCVYVDTRLAYRRMTEHLISLGHKKIGLLINASHSLYIVNRETGYRDALQAANLTINEDWILRTSPDGAATHHDESGEMRIWSVSDYQCGFWGMSMLLAKRDRPTAVVSLSDEAAIGALRAADIAGVNVPEEMAVMGYDDKPPAAYARVPLSTMHQPDDAIGAEAVSLLIDRINGHLPRSPVVRALPTELVIRESCGSRRATSSTP